MAKVLGAIFTILGFLGSVFVLFLYWNTSAHLPYNPADEGTIHFGDTGLMLPALMFGFLLIVGLVFWTQSNEPALGKDPSGGDAH
jgi:hypothetical protein